MSGEDLDVEMEDKRENEVGFGFQSFPNLASTSFRLDGNMPKTRARTLSPRLVPANVTFMTFPTPTPPTDTPPTLPQDNPMDDRMEIEFDDDGAGAMEMDFGDDTDNKSQWKDIPSSEIPVKPKFVFQKKSPPLQSILYRLDLRVRQIEVKERDFGLRSGSRSASKDPNAVTFVFTKYNAAYENRLATSYIKDVHYVIDKPGLTSGGAKRIWVEMNLFFSFFHDSKYSPIPSDIRSCLSENVLLMIVKEEDNLLKTKKAYRKPFEKRADKTLLNQARELKSEVAWLVAQRGFPEEEYYRIIFTRNIDGKNMLRFISPQDDLSPEEDQIILVLDERLISFSDYFCLYNDTGINKVMPSCVKVSRRQVELNKRVQTLFDVKSSEEKMETQCDKDLEEDPLYDSDEENDDSMDETSDSEEKGSGDERESDDDMDTDSDEEEEEKTSEISEEAIKKRALGEDKWIYYDLASLLKVLATLHLLLGLCLSNNMVLKIGTDAAAGIPGFFGPISLTFNYVNSVIFGTQKTTLWSILGGKEELENYKKHWGPIREQIQKLKKEGIKVIVRGVTFHFNVFFVLTTDLKSFWALCENQGLHSHFCAFCTIIFGSRQTKVPKGDRLLVSDFFDINVFIICVMHLWERLVEFSTTLVTFLRSEYIPIVEIIVKSVQYDFKFNDKPSKDEFENTTRLGTSMIKYKYCRDILVALCKKIEQIYPIPRKCKSRKKSRIIRARDKMKTLLTLLVRIMDITLMLPDQITEAIFTEIDDIGKKIFDIITDVNRKHFPIYLHYLVLEVSKMIRRFGCLIWWIGQGVEKKNQDRVYIIARKIRKNCEVLSQQINIELRQYVILADRLTQFASSVKSNYLEHIQKSVIWCPADHKVNYVQEMKLAKQESNLKNILNLLRHRTIQTGTKISVWRKNPVFFHNFVEKFDAVERKVRENVSK